MDRKARPSVEKDVIAMAENDKAGNGREAVPPSAHAEQLSIAERQINVLRDKLRAVDRQLASATSNNTRMTEMLQAAKAEIQRLKSSLEHEGQPPYSFGSIVQINRKRPAGGASTAVTDESVDVVSSGRKMRVGLSPLVSIADLSIGQEVLLNEAFEVVASLGFERSGELVTIKELLGHDRVLVIGRGDEERVLRLSGPLQLERLRVGDAVSVDNRTGCALEKVPRSEVENLVLEEVPDISYQDIGGLASQIEQIRDAVELPFLHPDLFREHGLKAPKGILLYGPP